MIVLLDSSVRISYFHREDVHHSKAVDIVEDCIENQVVVLLPDIIFAEVTNVLLRLDPSGVFLQEFRNYAIRFERLTAFVSGSHEFWMKTMEEMARKIRLKTLDLIIIAYAHHFRVEKFHSFDKQQQKHAATILQLGS